MVPINTVLINKQKNILTLTLSVDRKGLERQRLIGSAVAGFYHAMIITKASDTSLETRQGDYDEGLCSPESLVDNPVR